MECYVIKTEKTDEATGYFNRTFYLQGVGLSGMVPIRVCYFGKVVGKDEKGKDIVRDEDFRAREELLDMFAAKYGTGEVCNSVPVIAKPKKVEGEEEVFNFFVVAGKELIPVEVIDFSTDKRADSRYRGNLAKMKFLAGV